MRSLQAFSRETMPLADALKRVLGASVCKREWADMVTAMTTTHAAEPVKPRSLGYRNELSCIFPTSSYSAYCLGGGGGVGDARRSSTYAAQLQEPEHPARLLSPVLTTPALPDSLTRTLQFLFGAFKFGLPWPTP